MGHLLLPALNLLALLGILFYFLRKPVTNHVQERHESIRRELDETRKALSHAQAQYEEFSAKLKVVEAEAASIRDQSRREVEAATQAIISNANRLSNEMVSEAQRGAEQLSTDVRQEVATEIGLKVLAQTEEILRGRLTGDDRARIRNGFSADLEGMS